MTVQDDPVLDPSPTEQARVEPDRGDLVGTKMILVLPSEPVALRVLIRVASSRTVI
jgi:hypothetical protein